MISCKIVNKKSKTVSKSKAEAFSDSANSSYDFDYEDDDGDEQVGDVDVENKYFSAKQLKTEDPETAIKEFLGVPALEDGKTEMYFGRECNLNGLPADIEVGALKA